jgi:large subunit ribosomal protein L28
MAQRCDICGRGPQFGSNVSFSQRHTRRKWLANLRRVKTRRGRTITTVKVCARCLKAGKVTRVS